MLMSYQKGRTGAGGADPENGGGPIMGHAIACCSRVRIYCRDLESKSRWRVGSFLGRGYDSDICGDILAMDRIILMRGCRGPQARQCATRVNHASRVTRRVRHVYWVVAVNGAWEQNPSTKRGGYL